MPLYTPHLLQRPGLPGTQYLRNTHSSSIINTNYQCLVLSKRHKFTITQDKTKEFAVIFKCKNTNRYNVHGHIHFTVFLGKMGEQVLKNKFSILMEKKGIMEVLVTLFQWECKSKVDLDAYTDTG